MAKREESLGTDSPKVQVGLVLQTGGEFIIIIAEGKEHRMATMKESEKMRGAAEVKVNSEIRKLRKACGAASPNQMLVANLVAGLDAAFKLLIDNHKSHVMKMNAQLSEPWFSQFITKLEDAVEEVKGLAQVVIQSADGGRVPIPEVDMRRLKQDYAMMGLSLDTQLVLMKAAQWGSCPRSGTELSNLIYVDRGERQARGRARCSLPAEDPGS